MSSVSRPNYDLEACRRQARARRFWWACGFGVKRFVLYTVYAAGAALATGGIVVGVIYGLAVATGR